MKIKVFISSVQKELEDERLALQILLTTEPFLSEHCVPILYEDCVFRAKVTTHSGAK